MTDRPIVEAHGLTHAYGATPVLDGVDLTLARGEVLALLGPNGAGKTTTVRILTTLLVPDAGTATVAGLDVRTQPARVREVISLTGQSVAVDARLSGRENLTTMGRLAHLPRRSVRPRVEELLDAFGLADAADRRTSTYSGGMRRRLDLAAGLLARPQVLFLDEPTTGLDPRSRQGMWEVVRDVVAQGTSLFLTTQYLEEADQLADRVAVVDGGRVVAQGSPAALKAQVGERRIELEVPAADAERLLRAIDGASTGPAQGGRGAGETGVHVRVATDASVAHVRDVLARVEAADVVPLAWSVTAPTLDDVFLTLTGHGPAGPSGEPTTRPAAPAAPISTEVAA